MCFAPWASDNRWLLVKGTTPLALLACGLMLRFALRARIVLGMVFPTCALLERLVTWMARQTPRVLVIVRMVRSVTRVPRRHLVDPARLVSIV
jgi:hypothetical protein